MMDEPELNLGFRNECVARTPLRPVVNNLLLPFHGKWGMKVLRDE
jgi:hypothetical protein